MAHLLTSDGTLDPSLLADARARTRAEADRLRKAMGLTYRDLAAKSGTSVSMVYRLLRGPGWPREDHVADLSEALGLGPQGLTDYELQALKTILIEMLAAELAAKVSLPTDGTLRIEVDPDSIKGLTAGEIQEVILGAKKGAVAAVNEIQARHGRFRHAA
jgi:transcriptional regulator with XRE-family HTH domain